MNADAGVPLGLLKTGVPGLDEVLGGGLPELSFNLLAGGPGCGKTTLAHQLVFHNASPARPALYFTVLGEPALKMLRYQQQFTFFDPARVGSCIRFVNLQRHLAEAGLQRVLDAIVREVEVSQPGIVVVDSFRALTRVHRGDVAHSRDIAEFVQALGLHLTAWEATTFLLGEFERKDEDNPMFTVADGILWLYQVVERNSVIRKIQVEKMRGLGQLPGLHTFRMTSGGLQVFPRTAKPQEVPESEAIPPLLSTGVTGLDEMLCGGVPSGNSILVAGPSGSGKTVLSTQFIAEGARHGEPGIIAVFEKRPMDYLKTVPYGKSLRPMLDAGMIEMFYMRPLDLSIDETLYELQAVVKRLGARRLVIDSLLGFELALVPINREDFRESLYRMTGALTALGVTVLMTIELVDSYVDLRFSPHGISFLTDLIIVQRYVELEGRLQRVMMVVKHRTSQHSQELRTYEITSRGIEVGGALHGYAGLLSGRPRLESGATGF